MTKLSRPSVFLDDEALVGVVVDDVTTIKGAERPDVYLGKKAHKVILVNPDGTPFVGGGSGPSITVVDNLTSTSTTSALSANMGRVLNEKIEQLEVGGGSTSWENIENKPTTFPPAAHSHSVSDITGLQAELNSLKSRISELELEVDLLKNGTDDKVLQYLVKERIITNVIDEPRKGTVDVVQYPDDFQIGENFSVELKEE